MSRIQASMRFQPKMLPKGGRAAISKATTTAKALESPPIEMDERRLGSVEPESALFALAEASASRQPVDAMSQSIRAPTVEVEAEPEPLAEPEAASPPISVERSSSPELPVSSPGPASPAPSTSATEEPPEVARKRRKLDHLMPPPQQRFGPEEDDDDDSDDDMNGDFIESSAVVQLMVDADGNVVVNMETLKRARPLQENDERDIIEEHTREPRNVFDVRRREVKWSKDEVELLWEALSMTGLNYNFLAQWFGTYPDPNDSGRRILHRTPAQVKTKVVSLSRKRAYHYDRVVFGDLRRPMDFERFKEASGRDDL